MTRRWRGLLAALLAASCGIAAPTADDATTAPQSGGTPSVTAGPSADGGALVTVVERIVDGDTLYVTDLEERVRLIGMDTPETRHPDVGVECFGREATDHLARLVPEGSEVRVEFDVERTDRYGRPLGYLFRRSDGLHVNLQMVRDGYASAYTVPPNVRYEDAFAAAQREAREAGRGLWSACESDG